MPKLICSWCDKVIKKRIKTADGLDSHGMCRECEKKLLKELEEDK